jgi:hypothetical protein
LFDGRVLPVEAMIDATTRPDGGRPYWVVDGAQSVGNIAVTLGPSRADAYLGCFHKWLQGPAQTGFLWLRDLEDVTLLARRAVHALAFDKAVLLGLGEPVATECSRLGMLAPETAAIGSHLLSLLGHGVTPGSHRLAQAFRELLASDPSFAAHLLPAVDAGRGSGVVSLRLAGVPDARVTADALLRRLAQRTNAPGRAALVTGYVPRGTGPGLSPIDQPRVLRFSFLDPWNERESLEGVVERLDWAWRAEVGS